MKTILYAFDLHTAWRRALAIAFSKVRPFEKNSRRQIGDYDRLSVIWRFRSGRRSNGNSTVVCVSCDICYRGSARCHGETSARFVISLARNCTDVRFWVSAKSRVGSHVCALALVCADWRERPRRARARVSVCVASWRSVSGGAPSCQHHHNVPRIFFLSVSRRSLWTGATLIFFAFIYFFSFLVCLQKCQYRPGRRLVRLVITEHGVTMRGATSECTTTRRRRGDYGLLLNCTFVCWSQSSVYGSTASTQPAQKKKPPPRPPPPRFRKDCAGKPEDRTKKPVGNWHRGSQRSSNDVFDRCHFFKQSNVWQEDNSLYHYHYYSYYH